MTIFRELCSGNLCSLVRKLCDHYIELYIIKSGIFPFNVYMPKGFIIRQFLKTQSNCTIFGSFNAVYVVQSYQIMMTMKG